MIDHPVRLHAPSPNLPLRSAQRRTQIETALQRFLAADLMRLPDGLPISGDSREKLPSASAPITELENRLLKRLVSMVSASSTTQHNAVTGDYMSESPIPSISPNLPLWGA